MEVVRFLLFEILVLVWEGEGGVGWFDLLLMKLMLGNEDENERERIKKSLHAEGGCFTAGQRRSRD